MKALHGTAKWSCGITSACLVTPTKVYSFTETQTVGGVIKCEWYRFCEKKKLLPTHIQPLIPNITRLKFIGDSNELITSLSHDFGCYLSSNNSPKFGYGKEVLYVEMQQYTQTHDHTTWIKSLDKFYSSIRTSIQLFSDQLPEQLSNLVCDDLGIHNLAFDNDQLILLDPVYATTGHK